jgi:hypothetical protein
MSEEKRPAPSSTSWKEQEIEAHKAHVAACRSGEFKTPGTGGSFDRTPSGALVEMHTEHDEAGKVVKRIPLAEHLAKKAAPAKTSPAPAVSPAPSKAE